MGALIEDLFLNEAKALLASEYVGYLGYIANGHPYVVPITYWYDKDTNAIISYSGYGHKVENMQKHTGVSFTVTSIKKIKQWKSVQILGEFEELNGPEAKSKIHSFTEGIKHLILEKEGNLHDSVHEFSHRMEEFNPSIIYKINITNFIGKSLD